jgi:predicted NAD/FAD-dependent oxidoreductase
VDYIPVRSLLGISDIPLDVVKASEVHWVLHVRCKNQHKSVHHSFVVHMSKQTSNAYQGRSKHPKDINIYTFFMSASESSCNARFPDKTYGEGTALSPDSSKHVP